MIFTANYKLPPVNRAEVMRYAGVGAADDSDLRSFERCTEMCSGFTVGTVAYSRVPIGVETGKAVFPFMTAESRDLAHCLGGCDEAVIFAATVGIGYDRLIKKYGITEPSFALWLSALGSERVESLCDLFNSFITAEAERERRGTRPRYSPGYGDMSLTYQRDIIGYLECGKIGITLNESCLMTPCKSVTAVIGIKSITK